LKCRFHDDDDDDDDNNNTRSAAHSIFLSGAIITGFHTTNYNIATWDPAELRTA